MYRSGAGGRFRVLKKRQNTCSKLVVVKGVWAEYFSGLARSKVNKNEGLRL